MRKLFSKFALVAIFGFALVFTFSACSGDDKDSEQEENPSSNSKKLSSSSKPISSSRGGSRSSSSFKDSSYTVCYEDDDGYVIVNGEVIGEGTCSDFGFGTPSSSSTSKPSSSSRVISSSSIESDVSSSSSKPINNPSSSSNANVGVSCDISGQRTVKIGSQTWMAENLNCDVAGSVCYDNDPANCAKYGRLYNWTTAMAVCPSGWHLSSVEEWDELISYVESNSECSNCAGKHLKAKRGWNNNGTDEFNFSALPGGYSDGAKGGFEDGDERGYWWTSAEESPGYPYYYPISNLDGQVWINGRNKIALLSVRCVKDN